MFFGMGDSKKQLQSAAKAIAAKAAKAPPQSTGGVSKFLKKIPGGMVTVGIVAGAGVLLLVALLARRR